jgi:hypothetical protein
MNVLFFLRQPGYARNFESTLRLFAERGHAVHVVFDREKAGVPGESSLIERLEAESGGRVTHEFWIRRPSGPLGRFNEAARSIADYLRYLEPAYAGAPKLRARAESRVPGFLRGPIEWVARFAPALRILRASVRALVERLPVSGEVVEFIARRSPDLLLVSPLVDFGSWQSECLAAGRRLGTPTCLCVASWDNLTNKGLIKGDPGAVAVWNQAQADEAIELHGVPRERVFVAGAWAYDHWFAWSPAASRTEFCERVGLRADQPFVLYLCSSTFIARHEAPFVADLIAEMRADSRLDQIGVLVRPHPYNPPTHADGSALDLSGDDNAVVWPGAGVNPIGPDSKQDYFDSMHHCVAVVGVNTSALIESAILGRRVFTVLDPRFRDTQGGTLHFEYLLSAGGGILHVAQDGAELADALAAAIADQDAIQNPEGFLRTFIRPYGLKVAATPRLVEFLEDHAGQSPSDRGRDRLAVEAG